MRNHYIPRLVINRFSTAVNVFNLLTGEIKEKRPSNKVFFTKNIYKDEVEISLNRNLETAFDILLKKKLLKEGTIEITRTDLWLIKKYMFITSIRSQDLHYFCYLLRSLEINAQTFAFTADLEGFKRKPQRKAKDMLEEMDEYDFYNQQFLALIEFDISKVGNPYQLFNDERLCLEMAALACSFYLSYVVFWDAPEDGEFILSDAGIVSEYEGFFQITGGLNASKTSYLLYQMRSDKELGPLYIKTLQTCSIMYENYDLFNISSKRCIVAINPFFKLYDPKTTTVTKDKEGNIVKEYKFPVPDIWPAVIQNKKLFETPDTRYIHRGINSPEDIFVYEPKTLNNKEMIYINSLLINESREWIGFNNPHKVYTSFEYCLEHESEYRSITKPNQEAEEVIVNYVNNMIDSKFNSILKWCHSKGCKTEQNVFAIFEELLADIYRDFNTNIYIYDFYLRRYEQAYNLEQLDFLGNGDKDKKMEYLVNTYNRLLSERGGKI